jgi:hypothetical protein
LNFLIIILSELKVKCVIGLGKLKGWKKMVERNHYFQCLT